MTGCAANVRKKDIVNYIECISKQKIDKKSILHFLFLYDIIESGGINKGKRSNLDRWRFTYGERYVGCRKVSL